LGLVVQININLLLINAVSIEQLFLVLTTYSFWILQDNYSALKTTAIRISRHFQNMQNIYY